MTIPDPRTIPELRRRAELTLLAQRVAIQATSLTEAEKMRLRDMNLAVLALWMETPRIRTKRPARPKGTGSLTAAQRKLADAYQKEHPELSLCDVCEHFEWPEEMSGRVSTAIKAGILGKMPRRR